MLEARTPSRAVGSGHRLGGHLDIELRRNPSSPAWLCPTGPSANLILDKLAFPLPRAVSMRKLLISSHPRRSSHNLLPSSHIWEQPGQKLLTLIPQSTFRFHLLRLAGLLWGPSHTQDITFHRSRPICPHTSWNWLPGPATAAMGAAMAPLLKPASSRAEIQPITTRRIPLLSSSFR